MNTLTINRYQTLGRRLRIRWQHEPELPRALYFGLTVRVVEAGEQLAVIEWEGHRMLVEAADVEVRS